MAKGTENKIKYTIFPKANSKSFIVKVLKKGRGFPLPKLVNLELNTHRD